MRIRLTRRGLALRLSGRTLHGPAAQGAHVHAAPRGLRATPTSLQAQALGSLDANPDGIA
jgi:hypothetical protein